MSSPSVCLIYGFAEGPWHGQRFRQELERHGFVIEAKPKKAAIVIAHFAGLQSISINHTN